MLSIEKFRQLYAEAWKVKDSGCFEFRKNRQAHRDHLYYLLLNYWQHLNNIKNKDKLDNSIQSKENMRCVGVFADVNSLTPEKGERWEQMIESAYDGEQYIHLYRYVHNHDKMKENNDKDRS